FLMIDASRAPSARLTPNEVIGNNKRIVVHHDTLKARIRTHVFAHRLAHEPGITPGGEGIEQQPEPLPWPKRHGQQPFTQMANGREIANEGKARPQGNYDPKEMLGRLEPEFTKTPGSFIETYPGQAVAFNLALHPH